MDTKPPTTRPVDELLRTLSPEAVIQRLYNGGMTRLDRLLHARSASAAHEADRLATRHGAESMAAKTARSHATDTAHLARAARIDTQRSAATPQRAEADELVLLARLVNDQGMGVPCLETQLRDPTGQIVDTATSDKMGQVRLTYRSRNGKNTPAPVAVPVDAPKADNDHQKPAETATTPVEHERNQQAATTDHQARPNPTVAADDQKRQKLTGTADVQVSKKLTGIAAAANDQERQKLAGMNEAARDDAPVVQAQTSPKDHPRDHLLLISAKGKHSQQRVPVALTPAQTTVIEVRVDFPAC